MAAVSIKDAKIVSIEGWPYEVVLKRADICTVSGCQFVELDKSNKYIVKFLTGGMTPTRQLNAVEAELVRLRAKAVGSVWE